MTRAAAVLLALVAFVAACTAKEEKKGSPYPGAIVTGTVMDARSGVAVSGAHVVVWNEFDTGSANTGADGTFAITVDGADSASYYRIEHSGYRTRGGTLSVGAPGAVMGTVYVVSKDEMLVSTVGGEIFIAREGYANSPIRVTNTADEERTPRFSRDGFTIRWANRTDDTIEEAGWDGVPHTVRGPETNYSLWAIDWAEGGAGTVAWRTNDGSSANDIVLVENPGGFGYTWTGMDPAFSPPAFGWFGPQPISGNMVAFAGADGIYTAFPYFTNSFLVPEKVTGTLAGDSRPTWSPFRTDGTLHLGLVRTYRAYLSEVTAGDHTNVYSSPVELYGNSSTPGSEEPDVLDFDWAPGTTGQPDRIAIAVHFLDPGKAGVWEAGDVVVIAFDPGTGVVTAGPTVVFDASVGGDPAGHVAWR